MSTHESAAPVLPTPFHARTHAACRARDFSRWAGYATVNVYTHVNLEYAAVRNQASVFDLSPMIKYDITGADAERYLNRLLTRDVRRIPAGRVAYVVWCDDRGKVLDDGTLFRFGPDRFRLCSQDRHLPWLLDSAFGFDVAVEDASEKCAALALQGPTSCAVLKRLGFVGIENLRPFAHEARSYRRGTLSVSRTGFTGDLGYELWLDPGAAESLWDDLMEAGRELGIRPIGSRALDLVRIEAGFLMPHVDFMPAHAALRASRGRSPLELGLERLVDFDKGHFTGRRALLDERGTGSRYRVVGLDVEGNKPARDAWIYSGRRHKVGFVTSAMWSPTCKRNIAIATLENGRGATWEDLWAEIYVNKELKWEKIMARARVVERPFFRTDRRARTPAPDF